MMNQEEITIHSLADNQHVKIDYSDDDIIIIDNIKSLAEPSRARLKMNFIAICMKGRVQVDMNGQTTVIGESQLLLCPPNVMFSNFLFSHDFEFKVLFLTTRILQSFLREKISVWNEVMYIHKMHVLPMCEQDTQFLSHFYDMLRLCIDTKTDNPYRSEVIQSLIRSAMLGLLGSLKIILPAERQVKRSQSESLFQRFLDLLNDNQVKRRTVEYYASELCVTPKYLSTVCKKSSGKTANTWITEHTLEDIRYYLESTDLSIKQVGDLLGFPNPSFFGKYVKEHFGVTPSEFRRQKV